MPESQRGLRLIDVLVVLGIIAVLIGLFLPRVRTVRHAAARSTCQNNQKQLLLALHAYHDAHGKLPPGCLGPAGEPTDRLSWCVELLPYLEQDGLSTRFDRTAGYPANAATAEPIRVFRCPSSVWGDPPPPHTLYVGCGGAGEDAPARPDDAPGIGFLGFDRQLSLLELKDGTANTLAVFEHAGPAGPWAQGGSATLRGVTPATTATSGHKGGMNAAMGDGSVRFVREGVSAAVLAAAATVAGGEKFELD